MLKSQPKHVKPVTFASAVTPIQSMISLWAEQPDLSIWQVIGEAWQEDILSINFKFMKGSPNPNNSVGSSNIIHGD